MSEVIYEKKGNVAHISLNRPNNLNAISRTMAHELAEVWVDFRDDDNLRVAVLSGQGKSFCAGADITEIPTSTWSFRQTLIFGDVGCVPSRYHVWKPIIAAVHRHALGAGLWLILECDMRIAATDAIFGVPEVKYSIPVMFAAFLSCYLPSGIAAELLLRGNSLDSQRAYELGMVNQVVPREKLMSTAAGIAEEIAGNAPLAVRATKEVFYCSRGMDFSRTVALTEHVYTPVFRSEDFLEAKSAFKEKRKPEWKLR